MEHNHVLSDFVRRGNKAALLQWLKQLKYLVKPSRRILKRCGLTPTESLLLTLLRGLALLLGESHHRVCTDRFTKSFAKRLGSVMEKALDKPDKTDEVVIGIKALLNNGFGNTLWDYSLAGLKGLFDNERVAGILSPRALSKHKDTLSRPVDVVDEEVLSRTKELARNLIEDAKFDIYRIPTVGSKSCAEVPLAQGGKKKALYYELYNVYKTTLEDRSYLPTIVVTSDDGNRAIVFSEAYACETIDSARHEWNRDEVHAVAVSGPLKARIITKETASNHFYECVRRGIWDVLRKHEMFLIDGPVEAESIPMRDPGEFYVSGDYTAATDGFHPEVSEAILEVISDKFRESLIENCSDRILGLSDDGKWLDDSLLLFCEDLKKTLTNKTIIYPDGSRIAQLRGQLMGNLMSFPVLCIYNYVVFHISAERFIRKGLGGGPPVRLPLQRRVRINGDDILFPSNEGRYLQWKEDTTALGLELNDSKTRVHALRCNLNSRPFHERDGVLREAYILRVFGNDVTLTTVNELRMRDLLRCGLNAPGRSLFLNRHSLLKEKVPRCLPFPDVEDVLFNSLLVCNRD